MLQVGDPPRGVVSVDDGYEDGDGVVDSGDVPVPLLLPLIVLKAVKKSASTGQWGDRRRQKGCIPVVRQDGWMNACTYTHTHKYIQTWVSVVTDKHTHTHT